ncbi:MAG: hypothetical protein ABIJ97_14325 [Bacteroidota bacterium]
MNFRAFIIVLLFLGSVISFSQDNTIAPKYSNEFLAIGIGGRAAGMGNSVISTTNDVTSCYWNPAGITRISNNLQIGAMHTEYFAGIGKFDFISGVARLSDSAAFGVSVIRFGVDDIPNTLDLVDSEGNIDYSRIKSFSVADYAFLFSYAQKSKIEGLRYGANVKIIRRKVGEFAGAWGFGLDAGAQYDYNKWKFGATFRDVTSTFNAWNFNTETFEETFIMTGNEIPVNSLEVTLPKLLIGVSRIFMISEKFDLLAEIGLDISTDGKRNVLIKGDPLSGDPHAGLELDYMKIAYLRIGTMNFQEVPDLDKTEFTFQPSIGLGVQLFNRLTIDYAFTDISDQSIALYSHVISLSYSIDKLKSVVHE